MTTLLVRFPILLQINVNCWYHIPMYLLMYLLNSEIVCSGCFIMFFPCRLWAKNIKDKNDVLGHAAGHIRPLFVSLTNKLVRVKPRPHQLEYRSNILEFYKSNDLWTKSKRIEHVQFVSTLPNGRNFTKISFNIIAVLATKSNVVSTLLLV